MLMLSELLRFRVVSPTKAARLTDLVVSKLDTDYPGVTYLIYHPNQQEVVLPWKKVKTIDRAHRQIQVEEHDPAQAPDTIDREVRLRRDVLDALVIDLQRYRVTRANDLGLRDDAGKLQLSAVDTSAHAIWRRLARGRHSGRDRGALYDWKYIEFLRGDPGAVQAGAIYNRRIVHLPPGEIAHLAAAVPYLHAAELLELLPEQLAADVLELMSPERQLQVFEELDEQRALQLLKHMAPDLAADLIGSLDLRLARHYLNKMPRIHAERLVELLHYPQNTVGGIMANDMVTVSPNIKVGEARKVLQDKLKEPDFVYFIYVVEKKAPHRLRGVVSLRQFLVAEDDQTIEHIMNPYLIVLSPLESPIQAAYRLLNSQLAALPVVGNEGELLGTVTIDAAVSQVAPRSWRAQAPRVFS